MAAEPAGPWKRLGPGRYQNTETGEVLAGQSQSPNRNPSLNPQLGQQSSGAGGAAPAVPGAPGSNQVTPSGAGLPAVPNFNSGGAAPYYPNPPAPSLGYQSYFMPQMNPFPSGLDLDTSEGAIGGQRIANEYQADLAARYNRIGEQGPFGGAEYVRGPDGQIRRVTSLSDSQSLINAQREEQDINLGNLAKSQFWQTEGIRKNPFNTQGLSDVTATNFDGAPAAAIAPTDFSQYGSLPTYQDAAGGAERERIEQSVFDRFSRRYDPIFTKQKEELEQQLANQGVPRGSELYTKALQNLDQRQNDARLDAMSQATQLGGEEMTRAFNIGLQGRQQGVNEQNLLYQLGQDARQRSTQETRDLYALQAANRDRQLGERLLERDRPYQELAQSLGLQRGVTQPQVGARYDVAVSPLDVAGIAQGYYGINLDSETRKALGELSASSARDAANINASAGLAQLAQKYLYDQSLLDQSLAAQAAAAGASPPSGLNSNGVEGSFDRLARPTYGAQK